MESTRIDRVIITGASSGLGFDIARRFLELGAHVIINARDEAKLGRAREALGALASRAIPVAGPVGDPETARRIADAARAQLGGADVLVNNAGIFGVKPFLEFSVAELDAFYTTNVRGTFLLTQAIVPLMIEGGGGSVINIGTVLVEQPDARLPASAAMASKGGVQALTRSLSVELAPHRIRVNAIAPGIIQTPLIGEAGASLAGLALLRRVGDPRDISDAALYLARAGFVTGAVLDVDGGYAH